MVLLDVPFETRTEIFTFLSIAELIGLERVDHKWAQDGVLFNEHKTFNINEFCGPAPARHHDFELHFSRFSVRINETLRRVWSVIENIDFGWYLSYSRDAPGVNFPDILKRFVLDLLD